MECGLVIRKSNSGLPDAECSLLTFGDVSTAMDLMQKV